MTIIAYKAGVLAADTAVWSQCIYEGDTTKIIQTPRGRLVGASGLATACDSFRQWAMLEDGSEWEPSEDSFEGIVVEPEGTVMRYSGKAKNPLRYVTQMHALGYGYEIALGAMAAGADARKAVEIAIEKHAYCGGRIDVLRLDWMKISERFK